MSGAAVGCILLDSSLIPLASNPEALRILSFPSSPDRIARPEVFIRDKVRTQLLTSRRSGTGATFVPEFRSGMRRYSCSAYAIDQQATPTGRPAFVLLIERNIQPFVDLARIAAEFGLTPREREAVGYLLQGLTTKQIADRMKLSPSTVNAFLRLVMVKAGAPSRSAVVGRILRPLAFLTRSSK